MRDQLFVIDKPLHISSNGYLGRVKRSLGMKKVGFSGTLDPFASGNLIVATGAYTKLFQYLSKAPKVYQATLWLGADSSSLDIENPISFSPFTAPTTAEIKSCFASLLGELSYTPPKFSAKKIDGKRAYELAREGEEFKLKTITSTIYRIELLSYNPPFVHFEIEVSEGSYIRSIGQIIAQRLGAKGILSSLRRTREGTLDLSCSTPVNPFDHLRIPHNRFLGEHEAILLGKKLTLQNFEIKRAGVYWTRSKEHYAIIEITPEKISYKLNAIPAPRSCNV